MGVTKPQNWLYFAKNELQCICGIFIWVMPVLRITCKHNDYLAVHFCITNTVTKRPYDLRCHYVHFAQLRKDGFWSCLLRWKLRNRTVWLDLFALLKPRAPQLPLARAEQLCVFQNGTAWSRMFNAIFTGGVSRLRRDSCAHLCIVSIVLY